MFSVSGLWDMEPALRYEWRLGLPAPPQQNVRGLEGWCLETVELREDVASLSSDALQTSSMLKTIETGKIHRPSLRSNIIPCPNSILPRHHPQTFGWCSRNFPKSFCIQIEEVPKYHLDVTILAPFPSSPASQLLETWGFQQRATVW